MSWEIRQGDALEKLRAMQPESIQCCVTSPPYWGLRDYGTAGWEGGDAECDHVAPRKGGPVSSSTLGPPGQQGGEWHERTFSATATQFQGACGKCGATRKDSQLGLEPTPEEYVANLVEVFAEVRKVLRKDGTLWLNLGDSYAAQPAGNKTPSGFSQTRPSRRKGGVGTETVDLPTKQFGCKPKDLVGIPWMVAFALRADGWYLRSDIIWAKPNPMPESVTDRPTKAHEYLFLLTKSPRYFYDADAIREGLAEATIQRDKSPRGRSQNGGGSAESVAGYDYSRDLGNMESNGRGANKRSVWTVATQPYPGAHFATFPQKLIEPCILAGAPEGATVLDPFCGAATTGVVAARLERDFIGLELNPEYVELGRERIRDDAPLLNVPTELAA